MDKLRGSLQIEHTLARHGAEKLWELMADEPFVPALGALTGGQAVQSVKAGLKAIYCSGAREVPREGGSGGGTWGGHGRRGGTQVAGRGAARRWQHLCAAAPPATPATDASAPHPLAGWQVAADANTSGQVYPDQSLYPVDSVPTLVKRLNRALQRADQV